MQENHGNIYKIARTVSGLTQERWAEAIDVSVESVRSYENGTNFPGDERVYRYLVDKLRNRPEQRALYASFLGKLGDARAIDELKPLLNLTDLSYMDYIELRNAVEELGGDPGEDRTFYGDPDYEAMRNM